MAASAGHIENRYQRWIWESLKLVGGASVAAIIAVQLKLTEVNKELEKIKEATQKDIATMHEAIKKIEANDVSLRELILKSRDESREERREIESLIMRHRDEAAQERKETDSRLEGVKDWLQNQEVESMRRELKIERDRRFDQRESPR